MAQASVEAASEQPIVPESLPAVSLNILKVISEARKRYGVSGGDFKVYRKYCHKQLHRLRCRLDLNCVDELNQFIPKPQKKNARKKKGGKKGAGLSPEDEKAKEDWNPKYKKKRPKKVIKYTYRKVDSSDVKKESGDEIMIPLLLAERAWVYSQELYEQFDADHKRKYHHSNSRLRKAIVWSRNVNQLCMNRGDGATQLHGYAYMKYIEGCHQLQKQLYEEALDSFTQMTFIYQSFAAIQDESRFIYLDQCNSIAAKLAFLLQTAVDKSNAESITAAAKATVAQKFSAQLQELSQLAANASSAMNDLESGDAADIPTVEFQGTKVVVVLPQLRQLITQFQTQFNSVASLPMFKRGPLYPKVLSICEEALRCVREELKKYSSGIAEGARTLYVIQQYLHFQQLRLTVARLDAWRHARISKLTAKRSDNAKETNWRLSKHFLFYDLAQLCEEEMKTLDTIFTVGDADKHSTLQSDIECLRASYQLQRSYYIAKVYFYNCEYDSAVAIFQSIANECNAFAQEFEWKKLDYADSKDKLDTIIDVGCVVDIARHQSLIANLSKDSHKLYLLSRANSILAEERQQKTAQQKMQTLQIAPSAKPRDLVSRLEDFSVSDADALHVSSVNLNAQTLLPKPVMYDLAWNYVDYEGREHIDSSPADSQPTAPTEDNSTKKWFGFF